MCTRLTVRDRYQDRDPRFRDRDQGVCQSVRDETPAINGLETALKPRCRDRDHIPRRYSSLEAVMIAFKLWVHTSSKPCLVASKLGQSTTLYTSNGMSVNKRERERQTDRQTDRDRDRDTQREWEIDRERGMCVRNACLLALNKTDLLEAEYAHNCGVICVSTTS